LCVFLCGEKGPSAKGIHKEMFPVCGGKCFCRVKRFSLGGKRFPDDEGVETEVRNWLRQQSEDFYAAGFNALVNYWDGCMNVGRGYVEK
jgi:hypothetical protein